MFAWGVESEREKRRSGREGGRSIWRVDPAPGGTPTPAITGRAEVRSSIGDLTGRGEARGEAAEGSAVAERPLDAPRPSSANAAQKTRFFSTGALF